MRAYIEDSSAYVYWSTPQHERAIRVGDAAYIFDNKLGIVADGVVEEPPRTVGFKYPARLHSHGWNSGSEKSPVKTGIRITNLYYTAPLSEPRPKGHQTVELVK
jgi:hypothetical protein